MTREQYLAKRSAILNEADSLINDGKFDDAEKKMAEVRELDNKYDAEAKARANAEALKNSVKVLDAPHSSTAKMSDDVKLPEAAEKEKMLNSVEYRTAFMNNVLYQTPMPTKYTNAPAYTTTSDVTTIIPTVLVREIYRKADVYGKFLARAKHTYFPAGVTIPTSTIDLTAEWVAERSGTDDQEATTGSVVFTHKKLRCVVSVSLEADVMTLDTFEALITDEIAKAMTKAKEKAMFITDANGLTDAILAQTPPTGQLIEITEGTNITYQHLVAMEAAIPEEYEDGAIWFMPKATFYTQIVGMLDDNGQPVARTDHGTDGKPARYILGRPVEFCNYVDKFAGAAEDDIVAGIFNFGHYVVNGNMKMTFKKYVDEATDDIKHKALELCDGRILDNGSLVLMQVVAEEEGT